MDELDAAAQITPQDVERAKAAARRDDSRLLAAMLEAEAEPETTTLKGPLDRQGTPLTEPSTEP
jgi:hypothetical protein